MFEYNSGKGSARRIQSLLYVQARLEKSLPSLGDIIPLHFIKSVLPLIFFQIGSHTCSGDTTQNSGPNKYVKIINRQGVSKKGND